MTRVVTSIADLRVRLKSYREAKETVGLVPTMGALHEGHLSLVRRSKTVCDRTVVSIFVNPLQFGPAEDFTRYPRPLDEDTALLERSKVDLVFAPGTEEMYGSGFETEVVQHHLPERLCGASRPGHFTGVLTVVLKLFNIVRPDSAYFGQKDYQQSVVIRKMNKDLNGNVEIEVLPTVREKDGLALSSRNRYLSEEERALAPALHHGLSEAAAAFAGGEKDAGRLLGLVRSALARAPGLRTEYASLVDPETLADKAVAEKGDVILGAVRLGSTRLIDNTILGAAGAERV